jgi:hypothetical protein
MLTYFFLPRSRMERHCRVLASKLRRSLFELCYFMIHDNVIYDWALKGKFSNYYQLCLTTVSAMTKFDVAFSYDSVVFKAISVNDDISKMCSMLPLVRYTPVATVTHRPPHKNAGQYYCNSQSGLYKCQSTTCTYLLKRIICVRGTSWLTIYE